ncbi:sensor histidine kinase [Microbispora triticiradicis]|uniref:histidine kinase n=4 Tax=Streptosporangiaceae TaxID=2004 RepID=A0ABY3LZ21_9ACTN|nr:HAMP domain-containing sensor histidine kinase [Microbispora triticiradicis]RGA06155.1 sensor histidine kinase [Microbispora triticiradicis]TLP63689.1 HAMP domain-containing histidine kinase [Microbispora fusca]TYB60462.1 HAMP domain-containing histidine kinase [Microbispora tritici]
MSDPMGTGPYRSQVPPPPSGPPAWDGPPPLVAHPVQRANLLDEMRSLQNRVSIRWRLTLTYAALVFVAGALLVMVMYVLVGHAINVGWQSVPKILLPPSVPQEVIDEFNNNYANLQAEATAAARSELLQRSLLALLGVGIFALILGYVVADRALRPIKKMTVTARKLSETSLAHERIDLQGPDDELKELADTFDAMLTRLNTAFDAQRRFVDNASHELRTPLAINRTVLEVALSDPEASDDLKVLGRTLLGTTARNERLIEGLLLLARSERELSVRKPVDVQEVARTAVEQLAAFAEEEGVTVEHDLHPAATTGDPVLVERCLSNLVENGIKHNLGPNGKVWVRTGMVDGGAVVQVANTGPHVPAYEVESLFEPFRRLNADRVQSAKGAGLGLSIVRAIVRAHGGTVVAVPRDGGGLVVTVRLSGNGVSPGMPQSAR